MKSINTEKIFEAKQQLNSFLEEHPEMRELQNRITEALKNAGPNPQNRNLVLQMMMMEAVKKLKDAFNDIHQEAEKVTLIINKYKDEEKDKSPK